MKKLLFVINTLSQGGAEVALLNLLERLSPGEYEVSLLVLTDQGELIGRLPKQVQLLNKRYYAHNLYDKEGKRFLRRTVLRKALWRGTVFPMLPYLWKNLKRMLRQKRLQADKLLWRVLALGTPAPLKEYDVAIAFLEGGATYYVAKKVKAKKKAAFVHIAYGEAGYYKDLDLDCYEAYEKIFAVSSEVSKSFLEVHPECRKKMDIFPNILNKEDIIRKSREPGFQDEFSGLRLLTIGRLTPQKSLDKALEAMAILKKSYQNIRWYVLGDGPLRKELRDRAKKLGLEQDFIFLGSQENPYPYLRECDIYVHATGFEGKSLALQEAKVFAKPIVVSDCSGNREQIIHGVSGILCSLSPSGIAGAVSRLLDDKALRERLGEEAGKNLENIIESLEMLFDL